MTRQSFLFWGLVVAAVALSGVAYSLFVYGGRAHIGAIFSVFIAMPIIAFERRLFLSHYRDWLHGLATPSFLVFSLATYYGLMVAGYVTGGYLLKISGAIEESWHQIFILPLNVVFYTFAVTGSIVFVLRVRDLLGGDIFTSLLTGRYRKPVSEERVFLFIDLVGSTSFAEKHGDLRTQEFLGALFTALAEPVRRHRGAIDDYIGDAVIITWPLERGIRDARCICCVFDIINQIEANADRWMSQFGQMPRLRAALHGGEIITAEIGVDHHKIAYFGDTVNTTARLESLCRTLGRPVLISQDLAQRMTMPATIHADYLGEHGLRGRGQPIGVIALTRQTKPLSTTAAPRLAARAAE
ncbi:adenylate cyclase [Rhizobium sp. Root274]|uniref:adenylate/guanylate cyclase domain-containing protein n=1 Tax=unclassified Rhizobium TaxID=2613769 RepID=UPI00071519E8|nr:MULTISPECIES: adenylate/guanylate cyclase domain-containing protein [unclassified Rhizobium]KQW30957.1 adenylate cyclase [Rhizobium sp. Root1240]KRD32502.1 adenylate cyclase [Rhizobium sp. Root274]